MFDEASECVECYRGYKLSDAKECVLDDVFLTPASDVGCA